MSSSSTYLSFKYKRFAAIQLGCLAGFFLSLMLEEAVLYFIEFKYTLVIAMGSCIGILVLLSLILTDPFFNVCTSLIGSFMIARGVGLIMNYEFEFLLYYEKLNGTLTYISPYSYIYIGCMILGTIVSTLLKFRMRYI